MVALFGFPVIPAEKQLGFHSQQEFARHGICVKFEVIQTQTVEPAASVPIDASYARDFDGPELLGSVRPIEPLVCRESWTSYGPEGQLVRTSPSDASLVPTSMAVIRSRYT